MQMQRFTGFVDMKTGGRDFVHEQSQAELDRRAQRTGEAAWTCVGCS